MQGFWDMVDEDRVWHGMARYRRFVEIPSAFLFGLHSWEFERILGGIACLEALFAYEYKKWAGLGRSNALKEHNETHETRIDLTKQDEQCERCLT
jgi:hypothetical protein